jgi:hypothetical protein
MSAVEIPRTGTLIYVSLVLEVLRARPLLVVVLAASAQALLWTLVPWLFYGAPPGELAWLLALGHEFQLGSSLGPPLAPWLAELAHRAAGMFGVYALAQACVLATFLIMFRLGRSLVGVQQAALAVLVMVGISAFALPTVEFGAAILAMPLWALALLHYWRAVGEGRRSHWFALALVLGLLLLTSYWGLLLIGVLFLFTLAHRRGRAALARIDPWLSLVVTTIVLAPHLVWVWFNVDLVRPDLPPLDGPAVLRTSGFAWLRLVAALAVAHAGLFVLIVLANGWPRRGQRAPLVVRAPLDGFARGFIYVAAAAPVILGTVIAALIGRASVITDAALMLVPAGLALVVLGGDRIPVHRQRVLAYAWFGLLLVPPLAAAGAMVLAPWVGVDLRTAQPAAAMARYFGDSFERRTGRPLAMVTGDPRIATLIAAAAPSRPSLFLDAQPQLTPWASAEELRRRGGVVVWLTASTAGVPPPDIRARYPDLTPEVPRAFERRVQGRLPALRVGWGVIRPQQ